ncbi:MAG: glycoside hydrolase family 172 protein [Candidatus Helarchaeota archaeon]
MGLEQLPYYKKHKSYQVSTHAHDRLVADYGHLKKYYKKGIKHRDHVSIGPEETFTFPEINGPGKITNMWFTASPMTPMKKGEIKEPRSLFEIIRIPGFLKKIREYHKLPDLLKHVYIKIYFDDNQSPSVEAPFGVFFGSGFGEYKHYMSAFLGMTAGGYICQFHMPFKKNAKVEIVNTLENKGILAFFGAITYAKYNSEDYLNNQGYFHAQYRAEKPTIDGKPYTILDLTSGRGHFVGLVLNSISINKKNGFLFLEGNMEITVDGENEPSLEFTGTEDVFQGAWYYGKLKTRNKAEFYAPYHGLTIKSGNKWGIMRHHFLDSKIHCKTSQYRFFPEGVPFEKSINVIIHHGEFDEIPCNYDSVAYWYQNKP